MIKEQDYRDILELIWDVLIEKELSFIIKEPNGKSVGVSLNFDAYDEPEPEIDNNLSIIFEFLDYVERPIKLVRMSSNRSRQILIFTFIPERKSYRRESRKFYIHL